PHRQGAGSHAGSGPRGVAGRRRAAVRRSHSLVALGAAAALATVGFAAVPKPAKAPAAPAAPAGAVRFTALTKPAGIRFVHNSGRAGKKLLPETLGSGIAIFDADGDGWPDLLFINSKDWTPRGKRSLPALYHNNHDGTFTDVTAGSGLDVELYGMG